MINREKAKQQFYKICADRGLRLTPQRIKLFEVLVETIDHPTAETVYQRIRKKLPHISFNTVNQTLLFFVEHKILRLVHSRGRAKRFDSNLGQHHHFQCVKCDRIVDFEHEEYNDIKTLPNLPKGVVILDKKVMLEGICDRCAKKVKK